jgi:hypothetical protein
MVVTVILGSLDNAAGCDGFVTLIENVDQRGFRFSVSCAHVSRLAANRIRAHATRNCAMKRFAGDVLSRI